eukprot:4168547-Pleurochrysis_carterae.AAC.1
MHGQNAWGLHPGSVSTSHMPFVESPTPYDRQANAFPARIGCKFDCTHIRETTVRVVLLPQLPDGEQRIAHRRDATHTGDDDVMESTALVLGHDRHVAYG